MAGIVAVAVVMKVAGHDFLAALTGVAVVAIVRSAGHARSLMLSSLNNLHNMNAQPRANVLL